MSRRTYAIWWLEGDSQRHAGKLQVGPLHILLSGSGSGRVAIPIEEIRFVDYRRGELIIQHEDAKTLVIGSLDGPGALLEVTDTIRRAA